MQGASWLSCLALAVVLCAIVEISVGGVFVLWGVFSVSCHTVHSMGCRRRSGSYFSLFFVLTRGSIPRRGGSCSAPHIIFRFNVRLWRDIFVLRWLFAFRRLRYYAGGF